MFVDPPVWVRAEQGDNYWKLAARLGWTVEPEKSRIALAIQQANGLAQLYPGMYVAVPAEAIITPPTPSADLPGVVQLASFAGANWDAKLTAALGHAKAQPRIPWIMFPAADITLNVGGRQPFTGMKLCGPGFPQGPMNLEISSGTNANHKITLGSGITTGTNALFHSTTDVHSVVVSGLAFQNNRTAQFWSQPSGTLYPARFDNLTFYGMKHIFGSTSQKALLTQVAFTGHWTVVGHNAADTQFHIGGADMSLWMEGFLNINGNGAATGAFQIDLDGIRESRLGFVFCTSEQGWRGVRVRGSASTSSDLQIFGLITEGRNPSTPCHGTVLSIEAGSCKIHGLGTSSAMSAPSTLGGGNNGVVQVSGGAQVLIAGASYERATGVAETVPWLHASGSGTKVTVMGVTGEGSWIGKPRYTVTGGATVKDLDSSLTPI